MTTLPAILGTLESDLELPTGFLLQLRESDDWSLILKTEALVDAALTKALSATLDPRLAPWVRKRHFHEKRTACAALGLLSGADDEFAVRLHAIRDYVAHDVRRVGFNLTAHVTEKLNGKEKQQLLQKNASPAPSAVFYNTLGVIYDLQRHWWQAERASRTESHLQELLKELARKQKASSESQAEDEGPEDAGQ